MPRRFYCDNKFGDACEHAKAKRVFNENEVPAAMDGGNPRCPGKTESGRDCARPLVELAKGRGVGRRGGRLSLPLLGGAAVAALAVAGVGLWLIFPGGGGGSAALQVVTDPVYFPFAEDVAEGQLRLRNPGRRMQRIERIEVSPPAFTAVGGSLEIPGGEHKTLFLQFRGGAEGQTRGEALLYVSSASAPLRVALVASPSPWWVYDDLAAASTVLEAPR